MEMIISTLHSLVRWFILLFGVWAIFRAVSGIVGKKAYLGMDNKISLFFMICADLQLIIGLYLFFKGPWYDLLKNDGMREVMKDKLARFFIVEHSFMMIVAWLLIHIGRSIVKRPASDLSKHKKTLLWFGLAILLILISIPWPFRQGVGREWIRLFQ